MRWRTRIAKRVVVGGGLCALVARLPGDALAAEAEVFPRSSAATAAVPSPPVEPTPSPTGAAAPTGVDEIAARLFREQRLVGLVVGIVDRGGERVLSFGEVERGSGRAPDAKTIFDLGATTTTFTATLLAALAERGVVRLDDPLQRYAPAGVAVPSFGGRPIELVDLATHTSGLPTLRELRRERTAGERGDGGGRRGRGADGVFGSLAAVALTRPPGQTVSISGYGYALLARALAAAAKLDDAALLQRELCAPLGMADTGGEVLPAQRSRWAQGYAADGEPVAHLRPLPLFVGASDAHSTLADLMLFLRWNMGLTEWGRPLLPVLQERRHATSRPGVDMALAWRVRALDAAGQGTVFVAGGVSPGFHAHLAFVRETQTGVVLLSNTGSRRAFDHTATEILRSLNALPASTPPPESAGADDDVDEP